MKKIIILIAVALLGVSIFTVRAYNLSVSKVKSSTGITNKNSTSQSNGLNSNIFKIKAINFKLKGLDGIELSLSDLKGKKVFLNFWATWCPPCKAEMPEIEKLYEETKDSDLVIVAIEIGEPLAAVKSFINSNKYNFKVLLDSDQSISSQYNIVSIPTSFFIDADGIIVSKQIGEMNIDQMKENINKLNK
ncbi:MAG TPA: TlpA disulfide reductase family protein [Clostridiaceae bacterium]